MVPLTFFVSGRGRLKGWACNSEGKKRRGSERFISAASGVTDETTLKAPRNDRERRDITYLIQLEWTSKERRTMMMTVMMDEEEFIVILRIKAEDSLPTDGMGCCHWVMFLLGLWCYVPPLE